MVAEYTFDERDVRADAGQRKIGLDRAQVIIERCVGGIDMRIGLATSAYKGVVLALESGDTGRDFYRVKLSHPHDPDLTIALFEAFDSADVVAEWKRWAQYFSLPKFIEREAGRLEGAERQIGQVKLGTAAILRRRGATMSKRRPRVLARRKPPMANSFAGFQGSVA
jgi:hypothetical protein